jgi:hypothetical protein
MSLQVWKVDSLADRGDVRAAAILVFAARSEDRRVQAGELGPEVLATEVLIADQDHRVSWLAFAGVSICRDTSFSSTFGEVSANALGVPSGANRA